MEAATVAPANVPAVGMDGVLPDLRDYGETTAAETRRELIFVDTGVEDYQWFVDDVLAHKPPGAEVDVVLLDAQRDGITQISEALAGRSDVDAVHFVTHGTDRAVKLGATWLDADALAENRDAIAAWGAALSRDADLLFYGCDIAGSAAGRELLASISRATQADLAASVNDTGSATRGADWTLEYHLGDVASTLPFSSTLTSMWSGTLNTFTVTTTADSGVGSLRQAIIDANALAGADSISFNIGGAGVHTITLSSVLPTITDAVTINGYTQSGSSANTASVGSNAVLTIQLDGNSMNVAGLTLGAGSAGSVIRGLSIVNFDGGSSAFGIFSQSNNNVIAGNFIGLRADGTTVDSAGQDGVQINAATGNTIGGSALADRNVISGSIDGVQLRNADNNTVQGNYIGTDATGTLDRGNTDDGIDMDTGVDGNFIIGNVISGNNSDGIDLGDTAPNSANNTIRSNLIGTQSDGSTALGNSGHGILIGNGSTATGTLIGGTTTSDANTIAYNGADGVYIAGGTGVRVLGNSIFGNTGLGIDLGADGVTANDAAPDSDAGANNLQNFPVLTSADSNASGTTIVGSLTSGASTTYRIEFYANRPSVADAANGEGERYLGFVNVTTNGSGTATINTTLTNVWVNSGDKVTATATNLTTNETSEFAANITASSTGVVVVDTTTDVSDGTTTSITNLGSNRGADGRISLREAIFAANNTVGADRIYFHLTGSTGFVGTSGVDGRYVLTVASVLPALTQAVTIDATTQTTTVGNTNVGFLGTGGTVGVDALALSQVARPEIELVASAGVATGFDLNASSVTIRGFAMRGFTSESILLRDTFTGSLIEQNVIGSGSTAFTDPGAGNRGTYAVRTLGADNVTVQNNLMGFADSTGVILTAASNSWTIQNNEIVDLGIGADNADGIAIGASTGTLIQGNRITGISTQGVILSSGTTTTTVTNNTIVGNSVGRIGAAPIQTDAVAVRSGVTDATISLNVITANYGAGVRVNNGATSIAILQNAIYANGTITSRNGTAAVNQLGIDLQSATDDASFGTAPYYTTNDAGDADSGGNNLQNFPVLATASTNGTNQITFTGTLNSAANTQYRIEFFANSAQDGTTYGEGQRYLGFANVTTDGSGNATINATITATVAVGEFISATATKSNAGFTVWTDTSEFSRNIVAVSSAQATIVVDTTSDTSDGDTTSLSTLLANKGADGFVSLREAIIAANNTANGTSPDEIHFSISGSGPHTINLASALPAITQAVVIDGWSEPDYAGQPTIVVNGGSALIDGLQLYGGSGGSTVRGLVLQNFTQDGIDISGSNGNTIVGNYFGTDSAGTAAAGNSVGLNIWSSNNTIVGGTLPTERNVISGNNAIGLNIGGTSTGTTIRGNYIGLGSTGASAVANGNFGVLITNSGGHTIGGTASGATNVISGNTGVGIYLSGAGATGNSILGNYIGTDAGGTLDRGNTGAGISIVNAGANTVGGSAIGAGNVIFGNDGGGVVIGGGGADGNYVLGNQITSNTGHGVLISNTPQNNRIGGTVTGEGNTIASNSGSGVVVYSGSAGTSIQGNAIYANGGLGIDLSASAVATDGVTVNDPGDADAGGNNLQNRPVLNSVFTNGSQFRVNFSLNSSPSATHRIEFFASASPDPSGSGEAQRYLGFVDVTTEFDGDVVYDTTLTAVVAAGEYVTATATDPNGNTSEFSVNAVASLPTISVSQPVVTESIDNFAVFTVELSMPSTSAVSLSLALANGTATGTGVDFGASGVTNLQVSTDDGLNWTNATTATIAAGQSSILVRTPIVNDGGAETAETFTLTATRTAGSTSNASTVGTATINDNNGTPIGTGIGTFAVVQGNRLYSASFDTGRVTLLTTSPYASSATAINSLGFDSVNGIFYYTSNQTANSNNDIYGYDARSGTHFIVTSNVSSFGVTLGSSGLGGAGGDFNGGAYYFSTEGGGSGGRDQVYRVNFVAGSAGRTIQSITKVAEDNFSGATDFGDILVDSATGRLYMFNAGAPISVDEYRLQTSPMLATYVQRDTLAGISQAARDRSNNLYTVGSTVRRYDPAGAGSLGAAVTLTSDGVTAFGAASDAGAFIPAEGSIGDRVWYDSDTDGVQDVGETGVVGLTVRLYDDVDSDGVIDAGERLLGTTLTASNGVYTFTNILPGNYIVEVSDPTNIMQGAASTTGGSTQMATMTLVGETITDRDFGFEQIATLSVSTSAATVTEGVDDYAVFSVDLSNKLLSAATVDLALANITATGGGTDYGSAGAGNLQVSTDGGTNWVDATTATIAAGSTSVLVRTPIVNDTLDEATETFTLTASLSSGFTSNSSAIGGGSILDNDPAPSLSINDLTVNEATGTATFTVTLSTASGQTVSVNYATSSGTATSGSDFTSTSGTLNFAAGVVTQTITVPIGNDATFETSETFDVTLTAATNATILDTVGVGTIRDDGTGSGGADNDTPTLSVSNVAVTEGTDSHAVFTVSLSNASTQATTVSLALANVTATGTGTDYGTGGAGNLQVSTDGGTNWSDATTATIAAGSTSVLVRTPVVNDALDENAEAFTLTATRTAGTTTNASALGTATITDNDPTPSFTIDDVTVNEAAGTATFTVTLSAASGLATSVNYATSSGTATSGSDFTNTSGTLNFAAGVVTQTIVVPITNDTPYEGSETFNVTLSGATNATISDALGIGTIRDDGAGSGGTDDDRPTNVLPPAFAASEDSPATLSGISVTLGDPASVVTVTFDVATGVLDLSTSVTGGVTAGQISGNGTGSISITARVDAINATLADAAGLRFTSAADRHGTVALSMVTVNGLASDTDASTITVAPVADIADDAASTNEDTPVTISALANDTFEGAGRTITAVNGNAITAGGASVSVSNGSVSLNVAGQLIFTPTADYHGSTSFTYTVTSGGSTETANVAVSVLSVNDPLIVDSPPTGAATEDTPFVFSSANGNALTISDVDGGQFEVVLSTAHGTLTLASLTGLTFVSGDGTADASMTFRGTQTDLTAAMDGLTFNPIADYNGAAPIGFTVRSVATPLASLINSGFEQPAGVLTYQLFDESAVDGWDTSATDSLIEIWTNGYLGVPAFAGSQFAELNATEVSTLSQTLAVPADASLTLSFAHRGRNGVDVMSVRVTDLGLNGALGGGDDTVLLLESFSDDNVAWGSYTRDLGIATGSNLLLEFTSVSAAGGSLSIGNFLDEISLIAEEYEARNVTVNVAAVPDIVADTASTNEDVPVTISALVNDTFEGASPTIAAVDGQAVTANGPAVSVSNGTVSLNGSNQLIFTPTPQYTGPAVFSYTVTSGGVTETANVTVTVDPINDPPILDLDSTTGGTGYTTSYMENDFAVEVVGTNVTIGDLDNATLSGAQLVLTNAQTDDTLWIIGTQPTGITGSVDTSVIGQITVNFTGVASLADYQTALQQVVFLSTSEDPSTVARQITVTVNDGTANSNASASTVNVAAVNDAPAITVPVSQSVAPGSSHVVAGVSFSDLDAGSADVTVTLTVTGGTLTVSDSVAGGLTAGQIAGNTSTTVTLTGSLAAINSTLADAAGLIFQSNTSGNSTLTAAINDGGNSGTDPSVLSLPNTGSATDERASTTLLLTVTPPSFSVGNVAVTEGADAHAIFTVALSNPSASDVTFSLTLADVTALGSGVDFGGALEVSTDGGTNWASASSVTIAAGNTSVLVRTPIVNDALDENAETFTLTATRTAGATTNASAAGTGTITDNDPTPSFTIDDVTVNEASGTAIFTVTLSAASGLATSVNYATSSGTATSGSDFTSTSGTLNFAAGVVTQTIVVPIANDTTFENSESFDVTLSGAVNATISDAGGVGTIRDDGTGSGGTDDDTPTLSVSDVAVTEGTDAHAVFTVSLSNASTTPVSVNLALAAGSAVGAGTDFGTGGAGNLQVSTDGGTNWTDATTATIAAGNTSVLVRTPIVNDTLSESAEDFTLTATRTAGTTTNASALGTATITDNDSPPGFAIDDVTVNEAAGTATFTVMLSAASGLATSVNYATSSGAAISGSDFTGTSGTLNFAAGVVTQTVVVTIANDGVFENSEDFNVTLSGAVNATISDAVGVGTIHDDGTGSGGTDNDTPTLSVNNVAVTEGTDGHALFTVSLSNASTQATGFNLSLANGTANGSDYGPTLEVSTDGGANWSAAASAVISAGNTSVLVRTPIADDALNETPETFTLTAARSSGATTNASAVGTTTIVDDDGPPALSINNVTVNEAAGTATFTVTLSAPSGLAVSVAYATSDGSATAGADYVATSGTLNFAAGVVSQTIVVPITDDAVFENSETFTVTLSAETNAVILDGTGIGTIRDDGTGSGGTDDDTPTIAVSDVSVVEGTDPYAQFVVSIGNPSTTPVSFNLALATGSATGADFGPVLEISTDGGANWSAASSATIAAGETSVLVRSPIVNDALDENAESFTLTATRTAGTTANASAVGTATISDDDAAPTLSIDSVTVNEAAGTATLTVSLSAASGLPISVDFATSDGGATAGADYTATSGTLSFAAGVVSQTIVVSIANDALFENSEAFNVTLSSPTNATIAVGTGVGTIRDDGTGSGGTDNDTPTLSVDNVAVTESVDAHAVFTVSLSNPSAQDTTFNLALANGTATGADYGLGLEVSTDGGANWIAASSATIAAGNTSVLVRTPIINDALDEPAEDFTLTATPTSGTTTNGSAAGTAVITDDDATPTLSVDSVTVNEAAGSATFTVTLSAPSGQAVSVGYATSNATATAGADYISTTGTLNFAPGAVTQTIVVPIANDAVFENSETFSVILSAPTNATIAAGTGVGTIRDDGTGSGGTDDDTPTFAVSDVAVTEGADPHAVFTVSFSNVSTQATVLGLALTNGTATGADYGPGLEISTDGGVNWSTASSATIAAGETSVLVRTPIINDALDEAAETFTLTATRTAGATTNVVAAGVATITDDDATPSLSIDDVTVNEAAGTLVFTVSLNAASGQTVTVNYASADGTARAGSDYTATTGVLTFAPGTLMQTITVPIADDALFENSEGFTMQLSGAVNASIADAAGAGTIRDDGSGPGGSDDDTPSLAVGDVAVIEGTDPHAVFTVSLSNPSTTDVGLNLSLTNGTASGADFGPGMEVSTDGGTNWTASTTATVAAGSTSVLVRTPITDDTFNESGEDFTLTATVSSGTTTNATDIGVASIADDDSPPTLSINDVTVNEAAGTATFTVTLNRPSGLAVSANFITGNVTALAGADFVATAGTVNFAPGEVSQTVTVSILDDTIFENSESFDLILSAASNATIADGTGIGTIRDDGTGGGGTDNDTPTFAVSDASIVEGPGRYAVFTVSLSNPSTTPITLGLALADGTANGTGTDFGSGGVRNLQVSADGGATWVNAATVTISAGRTSVLVRTPITNDKLVEPNENFTLTATLSSGTAANLSASGAGTIVDGPVVPPPVPPPPFTPPSAGFIFDYDTFNNFSEKENSEREMLPFQFPVRSIEVDRPALLPLAPIYSGEADPGATLVIDIFNAKGERIGSQTVVADSGGNWLASFPTTTLRDAPNTARITQFAPTYSLNERWGHNLRTYFTPALNAGHFSLDVRGGANLTAEAAPLLAGLMIEDPLQLGAVKYGGEFLTRQSTASGY